MRKLKAIRERNKLRPIAETLRLIGSDVRQLKNAERVIGALSRAAMYGDDALKEGLQETRYDASDNELTIVAHDDIRDHLERVSGFKNVSTVTTRPMGWYLTQFHYKMGRVELPVKLSWTYRRPCSHCGAHTDGHEDNKRICMSCRYDDGVFG